MSGSPLGVSRRRTSRDLEDAGTLPGVLRYRAGPRALERLRHHQRPLLAAWLDRYRPQRTPPPEATADPLLIHPSPAFVAGLPGGRVPDRLDFRRFADDSEQRLRRWRAAVAGSEALGEQLLSDLESGRLVELVQPL